MMLITEYDSWKIIVSDDNIEATYRVNDWLEYSEPMPKHHFQHERARAVVEVRRIAGGAAQHAMVGGELSRVSEDVRTIRVGQSAESDPTGKRMFNSGFKHAPPLVAGMPSEFARPSLDGLVSNPPELPYGGTFFVVDRGGYGEVDSSAYAFKFASSVLLITLVMRLQGSDLNDSVTRLIES